MRRSLHAALLASRSTEIAYDASAVAIFDAMAGLSIARKVKINTCVLALKAAGIWTKHDAIWSWYAHNAAAAHVNWKTPGIRNSSLINTPAFTANSHFATNGTGNAIESNFPTDGVGGNFAQDSACFWFWHLTAGAGAGTPHAGWTDGTDGVNLCARTTSDRLSFCLNQATASTSSTANDSTDAIGGGVGLTSANRSGASATQVYRNGAAVAVGTNADRASTALNTGATFKFGQVSAAGFTLGTFRFGGIAGSLDTTEQLALYNAFSAFGA